MSDTLPPKAQLARVLESLTQHLGGQLETMLAHGRFEEGAAALTRLTRPEHREALLGSIGEAEAGWLAEELLSIWAQVGEVVLEPIAAVRGPREVWLGAAPVAVELRLQLIDVEATEVRWTGGGTASEEGLVLRLELRRPQEGDSAEQTVLARVTGRTAEGRTLLRARHTILLRVPQLVVDDSRTRLRVLDQVGRPGAGVRLTVGEQVAQADAQGVVVLAEPLAEGASVRVEGVSIR